MHAHKRKKEVNMENKEKLQQGTTNLEQELFEKCHFTKIEKEALKIVVKFLGEKTREDTYSMCKYSYHRIVKFADDEFAYTMICKIVELDGFDLNIFKENINRAKIEYQKVERELRIGMDTTTLDDICKKALGKLREAYAIGQSHSCKKKSRLTMLTFPKYSVLDERKTKSYLGDLRISEQELRFAFIETFIEVCKRKGFSYSIEAPTYDKYLISKGIVATANNIEDLPCISSIIGESASFDMVIYKDEAIACLIEFKANNPSIKDYEKDFLKLSNPVEDWDDGKSTPRRLLLQLLKSDNQRTLRSIENKIEKLSEKEKLTKGKKSVDVFCFCLEHKGKTKDEIRKYKFPCTKNF